MRKHVGSDRVGSAARTNRAKKPVCCQTRRISFESLEQRQLLSSVGLNAISNVTLPAGTAIEVALNASDPGQTVNFGVTTSDPTKVTPIVMPQTNKSVQFNINGSGVVGTMTFQLFDNLTPNTASHIETLVNDGFYNGDYIYRAQSGFVVQGGNDVPTISNGTVTGTTPVNTLPSGVPSTINEEFNPDLTYTSVGALAMARQTAPNTSGTEFFIAEGEAARSALDYSYTLFGFQTLGASVLQEIEAQPVETKSGLSYLLTPIKITSASIITDTQNGVLMLRAPTGVTGSFTVTVTAFDNGTNTPTTQTFTVNVAADTATGAVTNPWAAKTPAAPTSIVFQPQSGQGTATLTSANNSSTLKELQFLVSGVTAGEQVTVYADGVAIGSGDATSDSVVIATNGTTTLLGGMHTFTATETASGVAASWTDSSSNSREETANVDSLSSAGIQLQVFTSLAVTSTPATSAKVGEAYSYTVQTDAPSGDAVTVTPGTLPSGMQFINGNTFTWTPSSAQLNTAPAFSADVSDSLGNTASIGPLDIAIGLGVPAIQIPLNSSQGGNVTVLFSGSKVLVYNSTAQTVLSNATFDSTDTIEIDAPAGQTNNVLVLLPTSAGATLPQQLLVEGASGSTNNRVTVLGLGGSNNFTLAADTITANGLPTLADGVTADGLATQMANVQSLTLAGFGSSDYFSLNSCTTPTAVVVTGGNNTLDFSQDGGGVNVNLGLDGGQSQSIAPWNTTLSIIGVINKLIGSQYADTLTGGPAATTEIVTGVGNDTVTGGSGDNILMGGGGNDTFTGGLGRNLMIGGSGNCSFYAKGAENIVFAGATNVDSNDQALLNLLDDGSRITYGYSVRRVLASAAKTTALLSSPVSFQDTGAHDTIFGSNLNNWFVLGKYGTVKS